LSTLRSISQNAYAMAGLSSGLLNFQKEASDISKIIQNACKNLEDSLKPYHLIINIQENLPLIICDKDLLEVCLINFLTNSADNAPSKTNIEIEAKISLDSFILAVLDEGPGISEEKQNEIFDKFYTIPGSPSKGLGLGLSIAQSIATIHNAKIEVVNRLVRGLKVSFVMPI
jgi:two-component system sensor histidine kinase KdpD